MVPARATTNWFSWESRSSFWLFISTSGDLIKLSRVWVATARNVWSFPWTIRKRTQCMNINSLTDKVSHIVTHTSHPECHYVLPGGGAPQQTAGRRSQTGAEVHLLLQLRFALQQLLTQQQLLLQVVIHGEVSSRDASNFWQAKTATSTGMSALLTYFNI